jgi:hypothetical protein
MALVEPESFAGQEVARVYMAIRLAEAKHVERTLSGNGIDYSIEIEPYERFVLGLFPSRHTGVAFYVLFGQAEFCRRMLVDAGLQVGIVDEE